jgi:NADH-quinone oxidoreductase subunit I
MAPAVPSGTTSISPNAYSEESCPVDSIVETRILEYHGEKRGDLIYTKEMLLAVGDRYEDQIAKDRAADAGYR